MPFFSRVMKISPALPIMLQSVVAPLYPASVIGWLRLVQVLAVFSPPHTLSLKKSTFREILFQKLAVALPLL
jgi:hypothetical protein